MARPIVALARLPEPKALAPPVMPISRAPGPFTTSRAAPAPYRSRAPAASRLHGGRSEPGLPAVGYAPAAPIAPAISPGLRVPAGPAAVTHHLDRRIGDRDVMRCRRRCSHRRRERHQ